MKLKVFCLILIFSLNCKAFSGLNVIPFETDYCTSFPEGTKEEPNLWAHCCVEHDLYFWAGGTKEERSEVDRNLKECIQKTGAAGIAELMYLGVSIGKLSPIKFETKKWGNAWGSEREYEALTLEEISTLEKEILTSLVISPDMKEQFLINLHHRMD